MSILSVANVKTVKVYAPASTTPNFASASLQITFEQKIFQGSYSQLMSWITTNTYNYYGDRYILFQNGHDIRQRFLNEVLSTYVAPSLFNFGNRSGSQYNSAFALATSVYTLTTGTFGYYDSSHEIYYLATDDSMFYLEFNRNRASLQSGTCYVRNKQDDSLVTSFSLASGEREFIISGFFHTGSYCAAILIPYIDNNDIYVLYNNAFIDGNNADCFLVNNGKASSYWPSSLNIYNWLFVIKQSMANCLVTLNPSTFAYDGTPKEPEVTVVYYDYTTTPPTIRTLARGTDYTVAFSNNTNVGTANCVITGSNSYPGSKTEHFYIVTSTDINQCTVVLNPTTFEYDGTPKEPAITVSYQGNTLTQGIDYTVAFSNNINVGTANCVITGGGSYSGSRTEHFTITPVTIPITSNKIVVNLSQREFVYDGTAKTPLVTLAYIDQTTYPPVYRNLVRNQDYLLSYQNNINVGTASAIIVGRGDFSGTRTENFTIVDHSNNVNSFTFDYNEGPYQYTGESITVGYIGAYDDLGNVMTMNTDFSVTYTNNIAVGTASIIVTGIGYYTGQRTLPFYIVQDIRNPYGDQFSGPSHSYGTFTPANGPIPGHNVPTANASNSGLVTIFAPTLAQLQSLAGYLWTESSLFQTIWNHAKQIIENPLDSIITLQVLPVTIPSSASAEFKVLFIGTGVNMSLADSQFASLDCGYYDLQEFFGSSLDYTPYTKIQLFLPYVGYVDIDPDVFMGHRISVTYHYDITTGAFVAFVFRDADVFLQFPGNFSTQIPVTGANFSRYISALSAMTNTAIGAVSGGVVGAAMGLMSGQFNQPPTQQTTPIQLPPSTPQAPLPMLPGGGGSIAPALNVANPFPQPTSSPSSPASFAGLSTKPNINLLSAVMATKRLVGSSGSFNGASGFLGTPYCYLIIERPNRCVPEDYAHLHGWPCMMTLTLGDLTGYTEVQQCDLVNCPATNPEQEEILSLLKSGVIL